MLGFEGSTIEVLMSFKQLPSDIPIYIIPTILASVLIYIKECPFGHIVIAKGVSDELSECGIDWTRFEMSGE